MDTKDMSNTLALIEKSWKEVFPESIFKFKFLDETLALDYGVESFVYKTFRIFASIAIFIGCLGLYGLVSFVAVQRTKEVGIRKVLGASVSNILRLLSWDFLKLVLIAILMASPLAWYLMHQWLEEFAYRIEVKWWMFLAASAFTIVIALSTVGYQSIKAALANPVNSLKSE